MVEQARFLEISERLPRLSLEEESRLMSFCRGCGLERPYPELLILFGHLEAWPKIEVAGMPGAYKTTLLGIASRFLSDFGIEVNLITEPRPTFDKELHDEFSLRHFALTMFQQAGEHLLAHYYAEKEEGPLLLDRGVYNAIAFLDAFLAFEGDRCDEESIEIAAQFIDLFYGRFLDAIIICDASPQSALERREGGRVVTPEFLPFLQRAFQNLPQRIAGLRQRGGLESTPLLIVELDSNQEWDVYQDLFLRSIGSVLYRSVKGKFGF